ncbi:MAG TPA: hypothetical protein VIT92_08315 [Burkholderiaceae bacterium]
MKPGIKPYAGNMQYDFGRDSNHFQQDKRHAGYDTRFELVVLNPALVFEDTEDLDPLADVHLFGRMRETCPNCPGVHLQLVLRQRHVRMAHLACQQCHQCYDACYGNGVSALAAH